MSRLLLLVEPGNVAEKPWDRDHIAPAPKSLLLVGRQTPPKEVAPCPASILAPMSGVFQGPLTEDFSR